MALHMMVYFNICAKRHSVLFDVIQCFNFLKQGSKLKAWALNVFRIVFGSENLTQSCRGGFEEKKVSQKCS